VGSLRTRQAYPSSGYCEEGIEKKVLKKRYCEEGFKKKTWKRSLGRSKSRESEIVIGD
jgi:hypothetical protein